MDEYKFALEIKSYATYQLACAIWPHLLQMTGEQIHLHFLIFNETDGQFALYGPGAVAELVDHVENGPTLTIKKVYLKQ